MELVQTLLAARVWSTHSFEWDKSNIRNFEEKKRWNGKVTHMYILKYSIQAASNKLLKDTMQW